MGCIQFFSAYELKRVKRAGLDRKSVTRWAGTPRTVCTCSGIGAPQSRYRTAS